MTAHPQVTLYTDGACSGNPGPGGWGAILIWNGQEKTLYGSNPSTTNNQMELTAVIEGLRILKKKCDVHIFTDSKYVLQGATEWLAGWQKNNWRSANKKEVKNKELWLKLNEELNKHNTQFTWVKGHAGDPLNERADALAVRGREECKPL